MEWVTSENSKQTSFCCSHVTSQLASIPTAVTPYSISGMFLCNKIYFLFISNVRQHASRCSLKPSCRQPQTQGQSCHHAPVKYPSNLSTDLSSLSRSTSSQRLSPASLSGHQATAVTELPDSCPRVISSKCLIRRRCSTHRESKKWTAPMKYAPQGDYRLEHQSRHPRFEWCGRRIRR